MVTRPSIARGSVIEVHDHAFRRESALTPASGSTSRSASACRPPDRIPHSAPPPVSFGGGQASRLPSIEPGDIARGVVVAHLPPGPRRSEDRPGRSGPRPRRRRCPSSSVHRQAVGGDFQRRIGGPRSHRRGRCWSGRAGLRAGPAAGVSTSCPERGHRGVGLLSGCGRLYQSPTPSWKTSSRRRRLGRLRHQSSRAEAAIRAFRAETGPPCLQPSAVEIGKQRCGPSMR